MEVHMLLHFGRCVDAQELKELPRRPQEVLAQEEEATHQRVRRSGMSKCPLHDLKKNRSCMRKGCARYDTLQALKSGPVCVYPNLSPLHVRTDCTVIAIITITAQAARVVPIQAVGRPPLAAITLGTLFLKVATPGSVFSLVRTRAVRR